MPSIYFVRNGRLGNNIFQYMAAKIISKLWGHTIVDYKSMLKNPYEITDTNEGSYSFSWSWFCESVIQESGWLANHPLMKRDIYLNGYFQRGDIYLHLRPWLRSLFTLENTELLRYGVRVCDLMAAKGVDVEGFTLHLRLDDFQEAKHILHPKVYLEYIRDFHEPITIVMQKPIKQEESFYLAMFDSFNPTVISSSVLEDHATLRRAKKLITSNSTFAWTAAFLGDAEQRFIAPLRESTQSLGRINESDSLLKIKYIDLETYKISKYPLCFSGEDIQGLCEYTLINKEKKDSHKGLDDIVAPSRQLFLEDVWDIPKSVNTLAIYTDLVGESVERICSYFDSVRLLIIHNGDKEPDAQGMMLFLETYPKAHIYAQNNVVLHSRIHTLPMGIQNRMWQPIKMHTLFIDSKKNLIVASDFANTHPSRDILLKTLKEKPFPGLFIAPRSSYEDYLWYLFESMYSLCPPGNAHDTHRLWESLYCSARPVVLRTPFIERLLETCPKLPLHTVEGFESFEEFKPIEQVEAYSVYLYLEYWKELFDTYNYHE
jgi:hypothetical protein